MIIGNNNSWGFSDCQKDRVADISRVNSILDALSSVSLKMTKTASSEQSDAMNVVAEILSNMGVMASVNIGELLKRVSVSLPSQKTATAKINIRGSVDETIKIASKRVDDSHIFIDISKDLITKNDKSLILVCAYVREGYLGRFMMKRNVYYMPDNAHIAAQTYEEMISKAKDIKNLYYDGEIGINEIEKQFKTFIDSISGDLEFNEEDKIGSNVYINRNTNQNTKN